MAEKLPPITIYSNLMEEAKGRLQILDAAINGRLPLADMYRQELCYLQLRLLCEDIALGCLIAHGDISQADIKKLSERYEADKIINALDELNPEFYPKPVTLNITPRLKAGDPGHVHIEPIPVGFLTKHELKTLYGVTGNFLHKGKLKRLIKKPPYAAVDFAAATRWNNKIVTLLNVHHIASQDRSRHWICRLMNPADNGRVQVALAESPKGQE